MFSVIKSIVIKNKQEHPCVLNVSLIIFISGCLRSFDVGLYKGIVSTPVPYSHSIFDYEIVVTLNLGMESSLTLITITVVKR